MHIFKDANYDFLRWRWHALAISWVIILAGIFTIATKGIPKGVEFAGGTVVIERFDQAVSVQQVRQALDRNYAAGGQNTVVQTYGDPAQQMIMIRVPQVGAESGASLSREAQQVEDALRKANIGGFKRQGAEIVGATVGAELTSRGLWATALSLIGILAYLGFRFQFSFGVGAVIATIHDVVITLGLFSLTGREIDLTVIAALLTLIGYSMNDKIVVLDRVRENLRAKYRGSFLDLVNQSINQTLSRTILTAGLTLLACLSLYFLGGKVLNGIAFALCAGIVVGTYSSIFVASALLVMWHQFQERREAPAAGTRPQPKQDVAYDVPNSNLARALRSKGRPQPKAR